MKTPFYWEYLKLNNSEATWNLKHRTPTLWRNSGFYIVKTTFLSNLLVSWPWLDSGWCVSDMIAVLWSEEVIFLAVRPDRCWDRPRVRWMKAEDAPLTYHPPPPRGVGPSSDHQLPFHGLEKFEIVLSLWFEARTLHIVYCHKIWRCYLPFVTACRLCDACFYSLACTFMLMGWADWKARGTGSFIGIDRLDKFTWVVGTLWRNPWFKGTVKRNNKKKEIKEKLCLSIYLSIYIYFFTFKEGWSRAKRKTS